MNLKLGDQKRVFQSASRSEWKWSSASPEGGQPGRDEIGWEYKGGELYKRARKLKNEKPGQGGVGRRDM